MTSQQQDPNLEPKQEPKQEPRQGPNGAEAAVQEFDECRFQALSLDEEELREIEHIFRENIGNDEFNERTLERIKLPTGGLTIWQLASSEGTVHREKLEGIILQFNRPRAMWFERRKSGEPARPPDCYSLDGERGNYRHQAPGTAPEKGEPGGDCFSCRYNQPGSHPERPESRAKGCPEKRMLFMLTRDRVMPVVIQLPVTSITNFNNYKTRLFNEFKRLSRVITEITLEAEENDTGDPYSKALFRRVGDINDLEKIGMSRYEGYCLKQLNEYINEANRRQLMQGDMDDLPMLGPGEEDGPVPPGEMPSSMQPALTATAGGEDHAQAHNIVEGATRAIEGGAPAQDEAGQGESNQGAGEAHRRIGAGEYSEREDEPAAPAHNIVDDPFGESMFDHNDRMLSAEVAERELTPPGEPFPGEPAAVEPGRTRGHEEEAPGLL